MKNPKKLSKSKKTYKISENDYAKARRDRIRLLKIKGISKQLSAITKFIK